MDYKEIIKVFKSFSDEHRLKILKILKQGEICACKILDDLEISQSTLSHHMKILCDSGIVNGRKEGKWMYYSIDIKGIEKSMSFLNNLIKE